MWNYLAIVATRAAVLMVGFERSFLDGVVQLYAVGVVIFLICFAGISSVGMIRDQGLRFFMFYEKYCDPNGELKDEYLNLIYPEVSGDSFS